MVNLVDKLKEIDIVVREKIKLRNGKESDFYIDVKKAYGYPNILKRIGWEIAERIPNNVDLVVVNGYGGLPLGGIVSVLKNINLTMVRNAPKEHGRSAWIDGYFPKKDDKFVVVDDVFTSGGSLRKMIDVVGKTGAIAIGAYVVVKRGEGELSVPLNYLMDYIKLIEK